MIIRRQIKILRENSEVGILDCKNAITISNSNFIEALKILRQKELIKAYKVFKNPIKENFISNYVSHNSKIGVMIELGCQTDFVARNTKFQKLGHNLAREIAMLERVKYVSFLNIPKDALILELKQYNTKEFNNLENNNFNLKNALKNLNNLILLKQTSSYHKNFNENFNIENSIFNHMAIFGENIKLKKFIKYASK